LNLSTVPPKPGIFFPDNWINYEQLTKKIINYAKKNKCQLL